MSVLSQMNPVHISWKFLCSRHRFCEREQRKRFAVSTECSHRIWTPTSDLSPNKHESLLHARLEPSSMQTSINFKWSAVVTDRWRLARVTCCTLTPAANGLFPEQLLSLITESCEGNVRCCNLSFVSICFTYSGINNRRSRSGGWHPCSECSLLSCYGAPLRVSGAPHLLHQQTQYNATDFTEMKLESLYLGDKKELSNEPSRLIGSTQKLCAVHDWYPPTSTVVCIGVRCWRLTRKVEGNYIQTKHCYFFLQN
jgi:hypothetical protein